MKPKTIIYLPEGQRIKTTLPLDSVRQVLAQPPGTGAMIPVLTDHGTTKRAILPLGVIVRLQEA